MNDIDEFKIINISKEDIDTLLVLIEEHAEYEKEVYDGDGKVGRMVEYIFGKNSLLYCLVIEYKGDIVGYTTYLKQFSTWNAAFYLYIDCLYIREEFRNMGIGRKVFKRLKMEAKYLECNLIQWQTPSFNTKAIKFYLDNGATAKTKERFFYNV